MTARSPSVPMHPDLDAFLYARMGEDASGMGVSVISAIARAGIDPWKEATRLAGMSPGAASQVLVPMITLLSAVAPGDAQARADRLVGLLPKWVAGQAPQADRKAPTVSPIGAWAALALIAIAFLFWTMKERPVAVDQGPAGLSSSGDVSRNP
jgi:hypothetical protein